MKDIRINRLTLENFKCHRHLELAPEGRSVSIYGDNATGKTSIYDAFVWLLFGRDSQGNGEKSLDIKPLDDGGQVADHGAVTAVEAELLVDGERKTFRRTCREVWSTRRGTGEPVCQGNASDFFLEGVGVKKSVYDAAVRELVPEELFRMLTSVSYFAAGMKWQERRAVLFDMAGTLTDRELLEKEERFAPLLEAAGSLSPEEYRGKLLHRKKGLTGVREEFPSRLDECRRILRELADTDFAAAREEEGALTARKEALQSRLRELEQDTAPEKKRLELREARLRRDRLESRNLVHRELQKNNGARDALRRELSLEQAALEQCGDYLAASRKSAARLESQLQDCRDQWVQVSGEAFAGGKCPTCGQSLPFEQLQKATEAFHRRRESRLAAITALSGALQEELEQTLLRIRDLEEEVRTRKDRIPRLEEQLRKAEEDAPAEDLPEYAREMEACSREIAALEEELRAVSGDSDRVCLQLRRELQTVEDRLRTVLGVTAREALRDQTQNRIAQLQAEADRAADALERIGRMLFLLEEFTRFKAGFLEDTVNGRFRLVSFRLFREQLNGGLEERCDARYGGVPYPGLNNAMKVNVGIDIINALSRHYGVTVPLFLDNAESVTCPEPSAGQVIRLLVSRQDKQLRTEG